MVTTILHTRQQKRHRGKEQTFGLCDKARVEWFERNITETCILSYVKKMTRGSSTHEAGYSKPVLWGNLEEWGGEGGGRGVQDRGSYVHQWLIHVNIWQKSPQYCKVIILSHVWLFATPWTAACQASLSITITQSLLKLIAIKSVMPSNHLILHCSLLLPSIFPSIKVFSNELVLRLKSFSFNINPSNEYSGLTSFRMDCVDLPAVQGILKSLLQHHSSKASIL